MGLLCSASAPPTFLLAVASEVGRKVVAADNNSLLYGAILREVKGQRGKVVAADMAYEVFLYGAILREVRGQIFTLRLVV